MSAQLPEPGSIAPDFTLPQDGGDDVTLSALRPDRVVLFFYPKDNTPGCTTEALEFTATAQTFADAGVQVFGISKDSLKKHENFRAKHALGVPLLSDADGDVCERYGVWGEKQNYGRTYMGISRTTVLIDSDGTVLRVWPKVRVKGHVDDVLAAVQAL
ncbi:thioredoxin-dependent thiol peroxidase [Aliiroseovarius subalbicans]|uniref:thioredoxin-dependent thiol peroxidase n=1 Tax=Aliiroseovarius subalbicans TaxID=2925840 RepID=UPI001F571347|nr:thioredoxin-dependent thiol peroxidase [Aliiroseovarius subalbicans]MCI2398496.1 thioredoxin-dependent thiol peroxidase [Aliiroseovarius subalbicans]